MDDNFDQSAPFEYRPSQQRLSWGEGFRRYVGSNPRWIGGAVVALVHRSRWAAFAAFADAISVADESVPFFGQLDDMPTLALTAFVVGKTLHDVKKYRDPSYPSR